MSAIIYLHGFLSSPASVKAQLTKRFFNEHYPSIELHMPTLPGYPEQAVNAIEKVISSIGNQDLKFIGSSMGGFLSTHFVEKYGGKAVVINPAVRPFNLLADYQGSHINPNTQEQFEVDATSIDALRALYFDKLKKPSAYKVLLQTEDETLDYKDAEHYYQGANLVIEQGGDHSFVDFERHLPAIKNFLFAQ